MAITSLDPSAKTYLFTLLHIDVGDAIVTFTNSAIAQSNNEVRVLNRVGYRTLK